MTDLDKLVRKIEDMIIKWDEGKGALMDYDLYPLSHAIAEFVWANYMKKKDIDKPSNE